MNIHSWLQHPVTKEILSSLNQDIEDLEVETLSPTMLLSKHLTKEYSFNIGKIEGMKYIEDLIESKRNQTDEETDSEL